MSFKSVEKMYQKLMYAMLSRLEATYITAVEKTVCADTLMNIDEYREPCTRRRDSRRGGNSPAASMKARAQQQHATKRAVGAVFNVRLPREENATVVGRPAA